MKTKNLFLLGLGIVIMPLVVYSVLVIMLITKNPTWETASNHLVTLPLSLATICYAAREITALIKETKTADNEQQH